MTTPTILLADNGSGRAEAVLNLRSLAQRLSDVSRQAVFPVSLQHAHKIPAAQLQGRAADTLEPFLGERLAEGERNFLLIPLFFGLSRALTGFIPGQVKSLQSRFGPFLLKLTDVLCPLPQGEPRLADIVYDQLTRNLGNERLQQVILVDHGSPLPAVAEVRNRVAQDLRGRLGPDIPLAEAVMERREGSAYDFNGELLETLLTRIAEASPDQSIDLAPLFLSPGRHAGPDGDIAQICERARQRHPALRIRTAPLVGQHPSLNDILLDRLNKGLAEFE